MATASREWWFIFIITFDQTKSEGILYAPQYCYAFQSLLALSLLKNRETMVCCYFIWGAQCCTSIYVWFWEHHQHVLAYSTMIDRVVHHLHFHPYAHFKFPNNEKMQQFASMIIMWAQHERCNLFHGCCVTDVWMCWQACYPECILLWL